MRIVCREHVADQFTVFNAGAFNDGIVIAQLDLHSTQACVAGQVNRNGKGLPHLRKLVRGRELQRRTCGAGKRHQASSSAIPMASIRLRFILRIPPLSRSGFLSDPKL